MLTLVPSAPARARRRWWASRVRSGAGWPDGAPIVEPALVTLYGSWTYPLRTFQR